MIDPPPARFELGARGGSKGAQLVVTMTAAEEAREDLGAGNLQAQLLAIGQDVEFCLRDIAVFRQSPDQQFALSRTDSAQSVLAFDFTRLSSKCLTKRLHQRCSQRFPSEIRVTARIEARVALAV